MKLPGARLADQRAKFAGRCVSKANVKALLPSVHRCNNYRPAPLLLEQEPIMLRELSHRAADNGRIEVSLDWDSDTNDVVLTLVDDDGAKQIAVSGTNALDAFEHPYAYMAGARQLLTPIAR